MSESDLPIYIRDVLDRVLYRTGHVLFHAEEDEAGYDAELVIGREECPHRLFYDPIHRSSKTHLLLNAAFKVLRKGVST